MGYLLYAARRILSSIVVLFISSLVIFMIVRLIPADPAVIILGENAGEEQLREVRRNLGLHLPIWRQYLDWMYGALTLNFGVSYIYGKPIGGLLITRFPRSVLLAALSIIIALVVAFPLAIIGAVKQNSPLDYIAIVFSQIGVSVPNFWLGIILILVFGRYLGILPPSGVVWITEDPIAWLRHSIMPAISLSVLTAAMVTRHLRSEIIENLSKDYVRTEKAFGLSRSFIIRKYVLKNAMLPTLTVIGVMFGAMIGNVVIIETVFAYPGIGALILDSILNRDYLVVQYSLLLMVSTFILINLLVDLSYGLIDPKIN
jgi:peptide/nickel transport system permease protein